MIKAEDNNFLKELGEAVDKACEKHDMSKEKGYILLCADCDVRDDEGSPHLLAMSGNGNTIVSLITRLLREERIQELVMEALYAVHMDQLINDRDIDRTDIN